MTVQDSCLSLAAVKCHSPGCITRHRSWLWREGCLSRGPWQWADTATLTVSSQQTQDCLGSPHKDTPVL